MTEKELNSFIKYDYLYITYRNNVMGRFDNETYTKENQGTILSISQPDLETAKSVAYDIAEQRGIDFGDIVISLNNKELRTKG